MNFRTSPPFSPEERRDETEDRAPSFDHSVHSENIKLRASALWLQFQQRFFALDSPAISSHVSVFANYPVTGNGYGDRVGGAGVGHGARGGWLPDGFRDLAVGTGCAEGNGLQVCPHPALEGGGLNIERQRCTQPVAMHLAEQIVFPGLHGGIVAAPDRERKLVPEAVLEFVVRSANWMVQIPFSVAAISMRPKGESVQV